jgi:predicted anti-sigma-YlaC factor YlaD
MTSCADARQAVSAGLDGERSNGPAADLAEHLADCPDCRGWASRARQIQAAIRRLGEPDFGLGDAMMRPRSGTLLSLISD